MKRKLSFVFASLMLCFVIITFFGCTKTPDKYNVNVNVWHSNYGYAYGEGTFDEGTEVTITAMPKQDSEFLAWMKENVIMSYESEYTFEINNESSGTYTAIFTCPQLELVNLKQIIFSDTYESTDNFSTIDVNFSIGSSFRTLSEAYSTTIEDVTEFDITEIAFAFDCTEKIMVRVNLVYTLNTVIDEEETIIQSEAETLIEIELIENVFESEEFSLNLPSGINGTATAKFVFEAFSVPEISDDNPTENE